MATWSAINDLRAKRCFARTVALRMDLSPPQNNIAQAQEAAPHQRPQWPCRYIGTKSI